MGVINHVMSWETDGRRAEDGPHLCLTSGQGVTYLPPSPPPPPHQVDDEGGELGAGGGRQCLQGRGQIPRTARVEGEAKDARPAIQGRGQWVWSGRVGVVA